MEFHKAPSSLLLNFLVSGLDQGQEGTAYHIYRYKEVERDSKQLEARVYNILGDRAIEQI